MIDLDDLNNRFTFHPARPESDRADRHANVRGFCLAAARGINELAPDGREKALAITKLEEAMMWANAAIARQEGDS